MPKGPAIRPTSHQARAALFDLIQDQVEGKRALDLFSGSGALGIECLSRGAAHVTFVDRSPFALRAIRENLEKLRVADPASSWEAIRADSAAFIKKLAKKGEDFDLILMDPPYRKSLAIKCLIGLTRCAILSRSGLVVVEHDKRELLADLPMDGETVLKSVRSAQYGDTALTFYLRQ